MSNAFHGQGSMAQRHGCDCKPCRPVTLSGLVARGHVTPMRAAKIAGVK